MPILGRGGKTAGSCLGVGKKGFLLTERLFPSGERTGVQDAG